MQLYTFHKSNLNALGILIKFMFNSCCDFAMIIPQEKKGML